MTLDNQAVIVLAPADYDFVIVSDSKPYKKLYRSPDVSLATVAAQLRIMADRIDPQ
jgi:hypothetical protein